MLINGDGVNYTYMCCKNLCYNKFMNNQWCQFNKSIVYAAELVNKACIEASRKFHKENNLPVNHEQFIIMEEIYYPPGILQIEIAKEIFMKRSYVCKFLVELEELNYIYREKSIRGKRQVIYKNYLTEQGKKIFEEIQEIRLE